MKNKFLTGLAGILLAGTLTNCSPQKDFSNYNKKQNESEYYLYKNSEKREIPFFDYEKFVTGKTQKMKFSGGLNKSLNINGTAREIKNPPENSLGFIYESKEKDLENQTIKYAFLGVEDKDKNLIKEISIIDENENCFFTDGKSRIITEDSYKKFTPGTKLKCKNKIKIFNDEFYIVYVPINSKEIGKTNFYLIPKENSSWISERPCGNPNLKTDDKIYRGFAIGDASLDLTERQIFSGE